MNWWEEFELVTFPSIPRAGNIYMNEKCVIMAKEDYMRYLESARKVSQEESALSDRLHQMDIAEKNIGEAIYYLGAAMGRMGAAKKISPDRSSKGE